MNNTKLECSLNDTSDLKDLILENPELPLLIFCGEEAYWGEYAYNQAFARNVEIKEITLYGDCWMDREDYRDELIDNLSDDEQYKDLSDEDYGKMIDQKVVATEFVKAIVIYVG